MPYGSLGFVGFIRERVGVVEFVGFIQARRARHWVNSGSLGHSGTPWGS